MSDFKPVPRNDRSLVEPKPSSAHTRKQQRLMVTALVLLVFALVSVLYRDRDFWFPQEAVVAEDQPQQNSVKLPTAEGPAQRQKTITRVHSNPHQGPQPAGDAQSAEEMPAVTATRTVLPPLEVEVIAGSSHRRLRPGTNSVQVDLDHGAAASRATPSVAVDPEPVAANVTKAAERVEISSDAADLVTHSVTPGYPMLARQMKVQGSVILHAVIDRDGLIQDLNVVSGPPILAGAAREAVKQWHFKPHYQGADPVETQAKITVNFTISTN